MRLVPSSVLAVVPALFAAAASGQTAITPEQLTRLAQ